MAGPNAGDLAAMMQQMLGPEGNLWDSPMVAQVAFHPRTLEREHAEDGAGRLRDGDIQVKDAKIGYRLMLPPQVDGETGAVLYFHGNAETCVDVGVVADAFAKSNFAVLSVDYRGYGWSTGAPRLSALCDDAADAARAAPALLAAAGVKGPLVTMGRSIGAASAVHVASKSGQDGVPTVAALIVDSGLMSLVDLPMVASIAMMLGPAGAQLLQGSPDPMGTRAKCASVDVPTLVMHGERDEIVPVQQAHWCFDGIQNANKRKVIFPTATHNDVLLVAGPQWSSALAELLGVARGAAPPTAEELRGKSVKELKALCAGRGLSTLGAAEKEDLVSLLTGGGKL